MALCGGNRCDCLFHDSTLLLMRNKTIISLLFLALLSIEVSAQCSMCRAVLETDADGATAEGINQGILYLMAFPYLLVGVIAYFVYRSRKQAKKESTT